MVTATKISARINALSQRLDFKDIRRVCEARGALIENGADKDFLRVYDAVRLAFIKNVGVREYITGRLNRRAYYPADQCVIYDQEPITGSGDQTIVEFMTERYTAETLPDRIDVLRTHDTVEKYEVFWI